jgi:deoxyadenosine/deoxycytidine kinase
MNGRGKTMIAQQIADRCKINVLKEKTHPMPIKWTFYEDDIINSSQNIEPANNCNSITQESELLLQHVREEEI